MMYRVGKHAVGNGSLSSVLTGTAGFVLLLSVFLCAAAFAAGKGSLSRSYFQLAAWISYGISVSLGSFLTAKRAQRAKLLWAALTGAVCFGLVLSLTTILSVTGIGSLGALIGISFGGILLGGILGAKRFQNGYK